MQANELYRRLVSTHTAKPALFWGEKTGIIHRHSKMCVSRKQMLLPHQTMPQTPLLPSELEALLPAVQSLDGQSAAFQIQLYKKILLKGLKNICFQQYFKTGFQSINNMQQDLFVFLFKKSVHCFVPYHIKVVNNFNSLLENNFLEKPKLISKLPL